VGHTPSVTRTTTKFSVSLPSELLAATDQHLVRPGETRSATIARVLREALRAAEDAELDAEYARVFPNGPSDAEQARTRALAGAAFRSVHGRRD
jgi:predicted naringenin-chalcone synthase